MKNLSQQENHPNLVLQACAGKDMTMQDFERIVAQVAGFIKMMTGVSNNAALTVMLHCFNKITDLRSKESYERKPRHPHPRYRQKAKRAFSLAFDERDKYRRQLLYPPEGSIRFFKVSDMPDEARRKYGIISDRAYFEFWEGTGALAHEKSKPLITSLHNKFRLSLMNHNVPDADLMAWGLVGSAVLELAVVMWQGAVKSAFEAFGGILAKDYVEHLYAPFSLKRVSQRWTEAVRIMGPEAETYKLDDTEDRNIQFGVEQLMELWASPELPFDSTIQAVKDFSDDIFATPGYAKKSIRELAEMRDAAVEDLRQQYDGELRAKIAATRNKEVPQHHNI